MLKNKKDYSGCPWKAFFSFFPLFFLQTRHFEENVDKQKNLCLEKFGMPDEENATVLKMSA